MYYEYTQKFLRYLYFLPSTKWITSGLETVAFAMIQDSSPLGLDKVCMGGCSCIETVRVRSIKVLLPLAFMEGFLQS